MLNELESQNDVQVEGILGKVRTLKDVSMLLGSSSFSWEAWDFVTNMDLTARCCSKMFVGGDICGSALTGISR